MWSSFLSTDPVHVFVKVRLAALAMICECVKTTDAPPPTQLRLLLNFVEVNGNSQSAGFRYPVLTSFKKVRVSLLSVPVSWAVLNYNVRCWAECGTVCMHCARNSRRKVDQTLGGSWMSTRLGKTCSK